MSDRPVSRDRSSRERAGRGAARTRRRRALSGERLEARVLPSLAFTAALGVGTTDIHATAVALDSAGNMVVTGDFQGTANFNPNGTTNLTSSGSHDLFLAKYSASGALLWAENMPGQTSGSVGQGAGVAIDGLGNIYVTGNYSGTVAFDPSSSAHNLTSPTGGFDVFVAKYDPNGKALWAMDMPGTTYDVDVGNAIAVDGSGNAYITGSFEDSATFGSTVLKAGGLNDIFVAKINSSGSVAWAESAHGTAGSNAGGNAIAVDGAGNIGITGYFTNTVDFNPGAGTNNLTSTGLRDIFIWKLDGSGNYLWAQGIGGTDFDQGQAVAFDSSGNVYATGAFSGTVNFSPGAGTHNLTSGGAYSIFVTKLSSSGGYVWAGAFPINQGSASGSAIALDSAGNVYTAGWFENTVDFNPGSGTNNLTSAGDFDVFIAELDTNGNYVNALQAGGTGFDAALGMAINSSGTLAVTGSYTGPASFGPFNLANLGPKNIFVAQLTNAQGSPPPTPPAPTLLPSSDSGLSNSDNITNVTDPSFNVGAVSAVYTIQLYRDGTLVNSRVGPGTVTDPGPVPDGVHSYTERAIDSSGHVSAMSPSLSVTIDTTTPPTPAAPSLAASDDSGVVGDGITNVVQPHLVGTVGAGVLVEIVNAQNTVLGSAMSSSSTGAYSVQFASPLSNGTYAVSVVVESVAGNFSAPSPAFNLTIDKVTPPTPAAPSLLPGDDSGVVGDGITNVVQPHLIGTTVAGDTVQIVDAKGNVYGSATVNSSGVYSVQFANPLANGSYAFSVVIIDVAGNVSAPSPAFNLTIDKVTPPTPTAPSLLPGDDSGVVGDGITNVVQPHLIGTTVAGDTVQIVDAKGNVYGSATVNSSGVYSVRFANPLANGSYAFSVVIIDVAGNVSAPSPAFQLTIDTATPPPPAAPTLLPADDSGVVGDGITSIRRPRLIGTTTPGWTVTLLDASGDLLGSATAASNGGYSVQPSTPLPLGVDALRVQVQDIAGNLSAASPALSLTIIATTPDDFFGDGHADFSVYRPATAQWFIADLGVGAKAFAFGAANLDIPVPADYDGVGQAETAVFRPSTGQWFIVGPNSAHVIAFGGPGMIPVPADYDGDGRTDLALFDTANSTWYIWGSSSGARAVRFGGPGDIPVPGDYDGDGQAEIALFRPSTDQWFILDENGSGHVYSFGGPGDIPVPADYDGDGQTDLAVFRPSTDQWFILGSRMGPKVLAFGGPGDIPIPGPYDGTGKANIAVFRPSNATWYIIASSGGKAISFGSPSDVPLTTPDYLRAAMSSASAPVLGVTVTSWNTASTLFTDASLIPGPPAPLATAPPPKKSTLVHDEALTSAIAELAAFKKGSLEWL
jgi:acyl dehydratase